MKTLWNMISVMALANFLAICGVVGWLWSSDRLDKGRVEQIREAFAETVTERDARLATEQAEADSLALASQAADDVGSAPIGSIDRLALQDEIFEGGFAKYQLLQRQVEDLTSVLNEREAALKSWEQDLAKQENKFNQRRQELADLEGSEQFRKTVSTYESMKADIAKSMMATLLEATPERSEEEGMDLVVAYLNAMKARARTKIIEEFQQASPQLASTLLERLRTRGLLASGTENLPDG